MPGLEPRQGTLRRKFCLIKPSITMAPPRAVRISETPFDNTTPRLLRPLGRATRHTMEHFNRLWNNRTGAICICSSLCFLCFLPLWLGIAILAPKEELCTPLSQPTVVKVLYFIIPCWWLQMMWMSIAFFGLTRRNRGWGARGGVGRDHTSMAGLCLTGIAVSGILLLVVGLHWSGNVCSDEN